MPRHELESAYAEVCEERDRYIVRVRLLEARIEAAERALRSEARYVVVTHGD